MIRWLSSLLTLPTATLTLAAMPCIMPALEGARQIAGSRPGGEIAVKRYFYALRPALSVRALRLDPSRRPPMSMVPLMQAADLDRVLVDQVDELIARKAKTNEAGNTIRLPDIERLVADELSRAGEVPERTDNTNFAEEAEALFLELVEKE